MLEQRILENLKDLSGKIGVFYKDLNTGKSFGINENEKFIAASIIKISVMIEAYRQISKGKIRFEDSVIIKEEDKLPDCGAIAYMHTGLKVTLKDLVKLMIIISDNTAANLLIKKLKITNINLCMKQLGISVTRINRLLFDDVKQRQGVENYFSPKEVGRLLELMWNNKLISYEASKEMINIMKLQQINHKIPYFLPNSISIAHKTGEDEGITHDVAIVFSDNPFILCFASCDTDVPQTENATRKISKICYDYSIKKRF